MRMGVGYELPPPSSFPRNPLVKATLSKEVVVLRVELVWESRALPQRCHKETTTDLMTFIKTSHYDTSNITTSLR